MTQLRRNRSQPCFSDSSQQPTAEMQPASHPRRNSRKKRCRRLFLLRPLTLFPLQISLSATSLEDFFILLSHSKSPWIDAIVGRTSSFLPQLHHISIRR